MAWHGATLLKGHDPEIMKQTTISRMAIHLAENARRVLISIQIHADIVWNTYFPTKGAMQQGPKLGE